MNRDLAGKLCCCMSDEELESKRISDEIDRKLLEEVKNKHTEFKLLLLGAGESGKSTFLKQMKIIHGDGFSEDERINYIHKVYHNVCVAMQTLVREMQKLEIEYEVYRNAERGRRLGEQTFTYRGEVPQEILEDCVILWDDAGIQECYRRRREFYIQDSATYFLPRMQEVMGPNYIPSQQDILHARDPTTGVNEYSFTLDTVIFRIVDVGGQRRERNKWIHCFENVTSILFLASLSEYDQFLLEEDHVNRLEESIALFQVIISSYWFQRSSIVLFLNKKDLLEEKIMYSDIVTYFPEFSGPKQDINAAKEFILKMFSDLNPNPKKPIYAHCTCATDTKNIQFVFNAVRDTILQINLEDYNLA